MTGGLSNIVQSTKLTKIISIIVMVFMRVNTSWCQRLMLCSDTKEPMLYTKDVLGAIRLVNLNTTMFESSPLLRGFMVDSTDGQNSAVKKSAFSFENLLKSSSEVKYATSWQVGDKLVVGFKSNDGYFLVTSDPVRQSDPIAHTWSKYDSIISLNDGLVYFENGKNSQKFSHLDNQFGLVFHNITRFEIAREFPAFIQLADKMCVIGGSNTKVLQTECYDAYTRKWKIDTKFPSVTGTRLHAIVHDLKLVICTTTDSVCTWHDLTGNKQNIVVILVEFSGKTSEFQKLFLLNNEVHALISTMDKLILVQLKTGNQIALHGGSELDAKFHVLVSPCMMSKPGCVVVPKPYYRYQINSGGEHRHFPGGAGETMRLELNDVASYTCLGKTVNRNCRNEKKSLTCQRDRSMNKFAISQVEVEEHDDSSNKCFKELFCVIPALENVIPLQFPYAVGHGASLECRPGHFVQLASNTSTQMSTCTCTGNQARVRWEPPFWGCNKGRCNSLEVANGRLIYGNGKPYKVNSLVEIDEYLQIKCDSGYVSQDITVTCQLNEQHGRPQWSDQPSCSKIQCDPAELGWQEQNGVLKYVRSNGDTTQYDHKPVSFAEELKVECQAGFAAKHGTVRCTLVHDGSGVIAKWDNQPICDPIACTRPIQPINGRLMMSKSRPLGNEAVLYGSVVYVECIPGFLAVDSVLECIAGDQSGTVKWSGMPQCRPILCDPVKSTSNVTLRSENGTEYDYGLSAPGTILSAICDDGFYTSNTTVTCVLNLDRNTAEWSQVPLCKRDFLKTSHLNIIVPAVISLVVLIAAVLALILCHCQCCQQRRAYYNHIFLRKSNNDRAKFFAVPNESNGSMGTIIFERRSSNSTYETISTPDIYETVMTPNSSGNNEDYLVPNSDRAVATNPVYLFAGPRVRRT